MLVGEKSVGPISAEKSAKNRPKIGLFLPKLAISEEKGASSRFRACSSSSSSSSYKESSPSSSLDENSDIDPVSTLTLSNNLLRERSKIAMKKPRKLVIRRSTPKNKPKNNKATTPLSSDGSCDRQQRALTSFFQPALPANERRGIGN